MLEEINEILKYMRVVDLSKQASKLGLTKSGTSYDLQKRILDFYNKPNFVENTYKELNPYEKEYLDTIVSQRYTPFDETLEAIAEKYKKSQYKLEKINYFFINGVIPKNFQKILESIIPAYEIKLEKTKDNIIEDDQIFYVKISDKVNLYIDEFIKYINEKRIKITSKKGLLSKKYCLEFIQKLDIPELSKNIDYEIENNTIDNINDIKDTIIVNGLFNLLVSAKIIDNKKEYFTLGKNYKDFIKLNKISKIRFLLEEYLKSNVINEVEEIKIGSYRYDYADFEKPRNFILETIKKLPINEWVNVSDFRKQIRMKDGNFIRKYLGMVTKRFDYDNYYYNCGYSEFDYPFIDVCLMGYFAVLGLIDVILDIEEDDYGRCYYYDCTYIRLTDFGAQILNLKEENTEIKIDNVPLIINDNKIIIPDESFTLEYQLFFDRFITPIKNNRQLEYELDFKSIAKAVDLGISLDEILNYINDNALEVPTKILEDFSYYKKILNKIKIKTVKILEFPDNLADTIPKLDKYLKIDDNKVHLIVNDNKIKEIKKVLEDNNLFCDIEEK